MNTSEDLSKIFYGTDASEKINLLKSRLALVEESHNEYFKGRQSKLNVNEVDRLHNHYLTITDSNGIKFGFTDDSDLEIKIKTECIDVFNEIFNSKN